MKAIKLIIWLMLLAGQAFPQCNNIDFIASKTNGCKNELIRFYTQQVPSGSSVAWYINNTFFSNRDTAIYFFQKTGIYDIRLEVSLPGGTNCVVNKKGFVSISQPEISSVTADKSIICNLNETIHLTAKGKNVVKWNWVIDKKNFIDQGPQLDYTFTSYGTRNLHLLVYDSNGCINQLKVDSVVQVNQKPDIILKDSNAQGCMPLKSRFIAEVDSHGIGIESIVWRLPGGDTFAWGTSRTPLISYNKIGRYNLFLKLKLKNGCSDSIDRKDFVQVGDSARLNMSVDNALLCKNDIAVFTNKSVAASPSSITWSFSGGKEQSNSTLNKKYVLYPDSGRFDVRLSYNYNGCKISRNWADTMDVLGLKANLFVLNPNNCAPPHSVSFQNTSNIPTQGFTKFSWRFFDTDGTTQLSASNLPNPVYTFNNYGSYSVSLTLTHNPRGCTDSIYLKNKVNVLKIKDGLKKLSPYKACVNTPVQFSIPAELYTYSAYPFLFNWTFYDFDNSIKQASSKEKPVVTYDTGALYSYKLKLDDNHGCMDSFTFSEVVNIVQVIARMQADTHYSCINNPVRFYEKSIPSGNHSNTWKFTNTANSAYSYSKSGSDTFTDISITYPGKYETQLTTATQGCSNTTKDKELLNVSGIVGKIQVSTPELCIGDSSLLQFKLDALQNYYSSDNSLQYEWEVLPGSGAEIRSKNDSVTWVKFNANGCYEVRLKVTGAFGCSSQIVKKNAVCVGVVANFSLPKEVCQGSKITLGNSSARAKTFSWQSDSNKLTFFPDSLSKSPQIQLVAYGDYTITLKAYRPGCSDSISKNIHVQHIISDFYSPDSLSYCAPVLASFFVPASDATSYEWTFENDFKIQVNDTFAQHYYLENTGSLDTGSTVVLIAKSKIGCSDTSTKDKYVKVIGPKPSFTADIIKGCEPLHVKFVNQLEANTDYIFLYGDGNYEDARDTLSHTFISYSGSGSNSAYLPQLIAIDTNGCNSVFSGDSIDVLKSPKAAFSIIESYGCEPFTASFVNQSEDFDSLLWDFNGDMLPDDSLEFPEYTFNKGSYNIELIASRSNGCKDTLLKNAAVQVYQKPVIDFTTSDSVICLNSLVQFYPQIIFEDAPVNVYNWDFGDKGRTDDTSNAQNAQWTYTYPGYHKVRLIASDAYGCSDTMVKDSLFYVGDTIALNPVQIHAVSVENNKNIQISWEPSPDPDFKSYKLIHLPSNLVFQSTNRIDTSYLISSGIDVANASYSYQVQVENICNEISKPSKKHQSLWLRTKSFSHGKNLLVWNGYTGWNYINAYQIYRKAANENSFTLIASNTSTDTSFTDKNLCNIDYTYYVEAAAPNNDYFSSSNESTKMPEYQLPGHVYPVRTTVAGTSLLTEWIDLDSAQNTIYFLDKNDPGLGWIPDYTNTQLLSYTDDRVDITKVYSYKIRSRDICGNAGKASSPVLNNIVLSATLDANENVVLKWNSYPNVLSGLRYQVEQLQNDNTFSKIIQLNGSQRSYVIDNISNTNQKLCYRITADFDSIGYQSHSNLACVVFPSRIFMPSAFTPNGDGLNDEFNPMGMGIFNQSGTDADYHLSVFDRWGSKLFESSELNTGWDGTFKGSLLPAGVYYYFLKATGLDGEHYSLSGSIMLIR